MSPHWGIKFRCDAPGCEHEYARKDEVTRHKRTAHHRCLCGGTRASRIFRILELTR
ncbi:hypothetical protein C8Q79DRAFT_960859 [Trametes meyenii]|nr:hypothetical protein C8Q79DRAFT_960859 [Trametes meyenii]